MANRALGLIEVKGYLGAIVAADAAVKAANVSLLNIETIKAGLNTVQLVGDVSAIKAAVDAAVEVIGKEPYYLTSHVISRLDDQAQMLFSGVSKDPQDRQRDVLSFESEFDNEEEVIDDQRTSLETESVAQISLDLVVPSSNYALQELELLKVVDLRRIAYREQAIGLTKKEIKFANKRLLIDALMSLEGKE